LVNAGLKAASEVEMDNSLRASVSRMKPSPEEFAQLTEAYKYAFGPDARIQDTADLWAAYTVMDNMGESVKPIRQLNKTREAEYRTARQREADARSEARQRRLIDYRKKIGGDEEEDVDFVDYATDAAFGSDEDLIEALEFGKATDASIEKIQVVPNNIGSDRPVTKRFINVVRRDPRYIDPIVETFEIPLDQGEAEAKKAVMKIANNIKALSPDAQRKKVKSEIKNPAPKPSTIPKGNIR